MTYLTTMPSATAARDSKTMMVRKMKKCSAPGLSPAKKYTTEPNVIGPSILKVSSLKNCQKYRGRKVCLSAMKGLCIP